MCRHWNKIIVERKPFGRMETPIKVEAAVDPSANMRTRIPMQVSCCGQENALNGMIIQETSPKAVSFCFSAETRSTTPEDPTLNPGPTEVNAVKNTNGFREEVDQRAAPSATETAADNTERDSRPNRRLREILLRQSAFLEEHLDPDSDLLNIFLSKRILNRPQIAEVKAKETFYQRNAEILQFISKNQKEKEFVDALKVNNQGHLANFIGNDGAYDNRFGGKWPLGEKELDILDDNQSALVDLLDPEELLNHLFSKEIVNKRQMESIRSKTTSYDKNETILEILRRRSLEDYENTIECLDACNQQEIAEILRNNGVLAEFHANMELSSGSVNEQEAIIVENFVELLRSRSPNERQRIQELVDRRLVGTAVGHSVVNYFFCRSLEDLESIRLSFESGSLRRSIETVYGRLMHDQEILKLRLTWNEDNYEKCHSYFGVSLPPVLRLRRQLINVMAWGVAKFDDHLYVLCREPKHSVRVFRIHDERREKKKKEKNDRSFSAVGEIPLNETKLPVDMAADASARLLFIADSNIGCVWRVTVDDHRVDRWLTNTGSPFTISVCRDGCLLMARWGSPSTLETYSSSSSADAPRLRDTVRLSPDIVHPLHSVETSSGNFVVIHTWKPNGEKSVSEVSRSGEIIHRFQPTVDSSSGGGGEPEVVRLMDPRHVTRDSSDRVLVADYRGHCVLVFSRDLKTCHRLLLLSTGGGGEEGIQLPRRLHHDAIGNEVIVAQHGGRQDVLLFGLSCSPEADAVEVFDGNCEKQNRDEEQSRVLNDQEFEKATETVASETTMNDVLFEILDIILQKCLLRRFLKGDGRQSDYQRDDQRLLCGVMAVSELWRRRIIRKRFKTQLMRVLTSLYGLSRKREAIVRNACPYLLETVRPKSSLPRLRSVGCLTDGEIRSANRAKDEAKRAAAVVEIIRRRRPTVDEDERRYASLVRCLRRTGQRQTANVLETGGVCIRVDVKRNAIEQSLREFLEKKQSLSRRWQRFGQQLNDLHMELINVDRDKDETLWILYKQKENYQQPRELPLDRLTNLIATVTTKGRSQETKKNSVNIDEAYFEAERAEREMTANSLRTFDVATAVYGVTEFKGALHFLCSDPSSLRLYGGDSYDLRREVELKEVLLPADIASSAVGNCLYVVDQSRNCVWRVDGDSYALERWSPAFEPFSLSVTEDGRVLMPRAGDPCAVETYGADASVGRVCRLPNEFADVQHAVESSNGNVVVSLLSKESKAWTICEVT